MQFREIALLGRNLFLAAGIFASGSIIAQDKKEEVPPYSISIVTDKADAKYSANEKIKFLVSLLDKDGKPVSGKNFTLRIEKELDKPEDVKIETKAEPVVVETSMDRPGCVLVRSWFEYEPGKKIEGLAGAGVDVLKIKASRPVPADFDAFWDKQKAELAKVPLKFTMTPIDVPANYKDKVESFDVKVDCAGGMPVSGYYSRPAKAAPKSCPAFISYQGAGVRNSGRQEWRANQGLISMDINAHGIINGQPEAFYKGLADGELKDYRSRDSNDPEKIYFRGMFLRVLRAMEFLKAQPEWDGKNLIVYGESQGGAQAFVAAGLDKDVTACFAKVPAMCDHTGKLAGQRSGWPQFINMKDGKAVDQKVVDTVPYYDAANFASRIKCPVYVMTGFVDVTCPPTSVFAAYNQINAPKEIYTYPLMGHKTAGKPSEDTNAAVNAAIAKAKANK